MTFHQRPPGIKSKPPGKDRAYLAAIHQLPCCICEAFGGPQMSPTEAHHTFSGRGGTRKTPDREAIPLCDGHHQAKFDKSKLAIHQAKATWEASYGPDRDWILPTQDKIAGEFNR